MSGSGLLTNGRRWSLVAWPY